MKRSVNFAVPVLLTFLLWSCQNLVTPAVVSASVASSGTSSSYDSSFSITWTVANTGNVPIAITSGTLWIRGSAGGIIAFSQTSSSLTYGSYFSANTSYTFTINGVASVYIPYYYDVSLTVADSSGTSQTYSTTMSPFIVN